MRQLQFYNNKRPYVGPRMFGWLLTDTIVVTTMVRGGGPPRAPQLSWARDSSFTLNFWLQTPDLHSQASTGNSRRLLLPRSGFNPGNWETPRLQGLYTWVGRFSLDPFGYLSLISHFQFYPFSNKSKVIWHKLQYFVKKTMNIVCSVVAKTISHNESKIWIKRNEIYP